MVSSLDDEEESEEEEEEEEVDEEEEEEELLLRFFLCVFTSEVETQMLITPAVIRRVINGD